MTNASYPLPAKDESSKSIILNTSSNLNRGNESEQSSHKLISIQDKPEVEIPFIPLFTYGTLRPGGSIHHLISQYIIDIVDDAFIYGDLYESSQGFWSVAKIGSQNKVKGALVALTLSNEMLASIFREEILFGYDMTWQPIYIGESGTPKYSEALVCTWNSNRFLGTLISDGDWLKYIENK